jgi:hypothetical protein
LEAGLRSISGGIRKESMENIHYFKPDAPALLRLGWIWKTDAIHAKISALWVSDSLKSSLRLKTSFDGGGFSSAAGEATLEAGRGKPWSSQAGISLGATVSRSASEEEVEWNDDPLAEGYAQDHWARPVLRSAKCSFSFQWPGSDGMKTHQEKGIRLDKGAAEFSLRWKNGENLSFAGSLSAFFSLGQKILISRSVALHCTISSPADGYAVYPWDSSRPLDIPDFRLALEIDRWL